MRIPHVRACMFMDVRHFDLTLGSMHSTYVDMFICTR